MDERRKERKDKYPALTLTSFLHVPSGLCDAGITVDIDNCVFIITTELCLLLLYILVFPRKFVVE